MTAPVPPAQRHRRFSTNVVGAHNVTKAALPHVDDQPDHEVGVYWRDAAEGWAFSTAGIVRIEDVRPAGLLSNAGDNTVTLNDPFARHPEVPSFVVTSATVAHGEAWGQEQMSGIFGVPGGADVSPQLSWSGAPESTQSYAVTVVDPDAPTGSGFWHWAIADIPTDVTDLPLGAGDENGSGLPGGAVTYRNDAGSHRFLGAAPPGGHGEHRYFIVVYAVDVPSLGLAADAPPALLGFNLFQHTLARATMVVTAETPA